MNSRGFDDGVDGVGGKIVEGVDRAGRPADFYGVDFGGFAEAEMEAEIVLGEVAAAAADFGDLADAGGMDGDASADGGTIAFCADQFEEDAVIGIVVLVEKERGRFADVDEDDVDVAGVEDVAESSAAARF